MIDYYETLRKDIRFVEGLNACMNCGVCSAICPAAEFFPYDPKKICNILQTKDNQLIEELLSSDYIWYCGQCMSCKTRCPRGNTPGLLISTLRTLSQKLGLFTKSPKGRQQYAIYKTVGESILTKGYCTHAEMIKPDLHPEQGQVWEWYHSNLEEIIDRLGGNLNKPGSGALRKISDESIAEVNRIFEVTGGKNFFDTIDQFSQQQAKEMGLETDSEPFSSYFMKIYTEQDDNSNVE